MICQKCKSQVHTIDVAQNTDTNDIYRKKKCLSCGYTFYTIEKVVKFNDRKFQEKWDKYHRDNEE